MVVSVTKSKDIPEDAVVLDEMGALSYAWEVVQNWESSSDTWALKYGPVILGGINAFSGIIINSHFRNKLKLASYGYLSSVIPISLMPGLLTPLFHRHLVSSRLLLMNDEACPICNEVRSTAIQLTLGTAYPMLLGPTAAMMLANRYSTARIPDILAPKTVFKFLQKLTRPFHGTLAILAGVQVVSSAVITYYETKNNLTIRSKINEIEQKLSQGLLS